MLPLSAVLLFSRVQETYYRGDPEILVPRSSLPTKAGDHRAFTNVLIYRGPDRLGHLGPGAGGPLAFLDGPQGGYYPADIRGAYNDADGQGSGTVVIVDAYDNPNMLGDFNTFAAQFGLPTESSQDATDPSNKVFQVVYAGGAQPQADDGWATEIALDCEWAHAMAPAAKIVLVEANSNDETDLFAADELARTLPGAREVSMSWAEPEYQGVNQWDYVFTGSPIKFFAASGDWSAGVYYPACSPAVVGVGGTTLYLNQNGGWGSESVWSGTGGGPSQFEARPAYQNAIAGIVGAGRGVPDIAAVADPGTPVAVYDDYDNSGWITLGGTSVATPVLAGIHNASTRPQLALGLGPAYLYGLSPFIRWHDITQGGNGYNATAGWDFCTGWGTPVFRNSL